MPDKRPSATPTVQIDNDNTIVTKWRFPPHGQTSWHIHQYDYVVVPLVTGALRLETPDGERLAELVTGQACARTAGVEHNVLNNDFEFAFIEIERK